MSLWKDLIRSLEVPFAWRPENRMDSNKNPAFITPKKINESLNKMLKGETMNGTIRKIVVEKAFGFIECVETNSDYFFHRDDFDGHWNDLVADFQTGAINVEFKADKTDKGLRARNVSRVDHPNQAV